MNPWNNERVIEFLNAIRIRPELWNVNSDKYKDRDTRKNAWAEIAPRFSVTPEDAYRKFKGLRTYAKQDEKTRKMGGLNKPSTWFAHDAVSFLLSQDGDNTIDIFERNADSEENFKVEYLECEEYDINIEDAPVAECPISTSTSTQGSRVRKRKTSSPMRNDIQVQERSDARRQLDEACDLLHSLTERSKHVQRDECDLYGELLAKKLRKMGESMRESVMNEIDNLVYRTIIGITK